MEFKDIILAILGTITVADIIKVFFIPQEKKAKKVENKDAEIATLRHTNEILQQQIDRDAVAIEKKDQAIAQLNAEIAELKATQSSLFDDMCIHKGCRLMKPHQGKGALWYEKYREDPALGADYESIDTLLKKDRAARAIGDTKKEEDEI